MPFQDFYNNERISAVNENTVTYDTVPEQFASLDYRPPQRIADDGQSTRPGDTENAMAILEASLQSGNPRSITDHIIHCHPPPMQNVGINQSGMSYNARILTHSTQSGQVGNTWEAPDIPTMAGMSSELDPFPHIDLHILDLVAMGSGHGNLEETYSRYTPTGQELVNTQHINGASGSNIATEAPQDGALLTAVTSDAPAYKFRRPRSSTKADSKTTSRRSRAPAVIATTPDDTAEGPIRCKICKKKFSHKQNLNRHVRIAHLGGCKWDCIICGTKISRHDALRRHLDNIHKLSKLEAKHIVRFLGEKMYAAV
ncbi:hypothetical protein IEO21_05774 [Rhodonia placenta]|uniref:C2H2-type domain-containing protein n=1 Tax=Rhodonia placenta TaxID=104341 RepID=A0A8H7P1L2_9APHY|nr:hypothetical protein IEO21_05774 [Postia placenta]